MCAQDPEYAMKKARVERLYAIADSERFSTPANQSVIFCLDEFGAAVRLAGRSKPH